MEVPSCNQVSKAGNSEGQIHWLHRVPLLWMEQLPSDARVLMSSNLSQDARMALGLCWHWWRIEQREVELEWKKGGRGVYDKRIGARNVMLGTARRLCRMYGVA